MRPPGFWSAPPSHPAARLLGPLGRAYGTLTAARMDRPGATPPRPVLCVGNFTLGGAGKTPTAIRLAALLRDLGARPVFLSRGYGGRERGPIRVDPDRHGAAEVGDEPLLLARHAPTVVARDRPAGAALCAALGAGVIVMDDGLQNPSLAKTLSLAVVDAGSGLGNGFAFPAGPLRVPLDRQWPHVAGIVLVGEGEPGRRVAALAALRGLPVHAARLEPAPDAAALAGRRVLAFAGIGRPQKFFETLRATGAEIVGTRAFPDHHPYRSRDIADLFGQAGTSDTILVTTEKDRVRLPAEVRDAVTVLRVGLRFENEAGVRASLAALPPPPGEA